MKKCWSFLIITSLALSVYGAEVDTIAIYSHAMNKNINCVVVTPDNYVKSNTPFPVLYLLHGHGGSFREWITKAPNLRKAADEAGIIVVCPDGGVNSWYFDIDSLPQYKYETHVSGEVIKHVDNNYRTRRDRTGRAIAGLSMGGHGALYLAIKHKDVYGAAIALSGGVDFTPFPKNWGLPSILGKYETNKESWVAHTVQHLVHTKLADKELEIVIDCGTDDFFIGVNRILHQTLYELKIAHDYIERPGKHNWDYWNNAIVYQMYFLKKYFETK